MGREDKEEEEEEEEEAKRGGHGSFSLGFGKNWYIVCTHILFGAGSD